MLSKLDNEGGGGVKKSSKSCQRSLWTPPGCQEKHDPWLPIPEITAFRSTDYGFSRDTMHKLQG